MSHLGICVRDDCGGAGLTVGLEDLKSLFQVQ